MKWYESKRMDDAAAATDAANKLHDIYQNLTYLDNYGTQIILSILLIFGLAVFVAYSRMTVNLAATKADWPNQRCHPQVLPIAGYIYNPDPSNLTAQQATQQNFEYCTQSTLKEISADAVQPLTFAISNLNTVMGDAADTIDSSRSMFDKMRTNMESVSKEIMGRLLNTTVPIQQMVISFQDMMSKTQGIMTSALFTSLGSYYTLKSLLGAIADLLIKTLVALAALIIIMWLMPFTWGLASSMTAIFIAISIPMALMLAFMSQVLHVNTGGFHLPGVPKKPSCFDGDTLLEVLLSTPTTSSTTHLKTIRDINVGDILASDGAIVVSKIRLSGKNQTMYQLNGVIVSGSHMVSISKSCDIEPHKMEWIRVDQHPDATQMPPSKSQDQEIIYCLNTTTKRIIIGDQIFCDWDEIITPGIFMFANEKIRSKILEQHASAPHKDTKIGQLINKYLDIPAALPQTAQVVMDSQGRTKSIAQIKMNDILWIPNTDALHTKNRVYGIVEIKGEHNGEIGYHLLTMRDKFFVQSTGVMDSGQLPTQIEVGDYNQCLDS